ncbi:PCP degradation transcriptional activation protein [compost metagenome]
MTPQILQRTDWMVTLPRRVAQAFNQHGQFTVYPLPVKIPEVEVTVHWHERFDHDEGNQWLREQIIETLRE